MRKTIKLIFLGMIPLVVGYALNFAAPLLPVSGLILSVIEVGLLFLWGWLAYRASSPEKNSVVQALLLCSFGLLLLVLALYQELVMGQYWKNFIGSVTQIYFVPFLTIAAAALTSLVRLFLPTDQVWPFYVAIWGCMFAVSYAGCFIKSRKVKQPVSE